MSGYDWAKRALTPAELNLAKARLRQNANISRLLGKWVPLDQVHPVLGQDILLDLLSDQPSEASVRKLEKALADGMANCQNFREVFRGNPSKNVGVANNQILDMLAEVEAYCWLKKSGFERLGKPKLRCTPTVDFVCERKGVSYVVEVTRLGRPLSHRKTTRPILSRPGFQVYSGDTYSTRTIEEAIRDGVHKKLPQLRAFLAQLKSDSKGIIIVSTGRGMILVGKCVRQEAGVLPRSYGEALENTWAELDHEASDELKAVVLLDGKNEYVQPEEFPVSPCQWSP